MARRVGELGGPENTGIRIVINIITALRCRVYLSSEAHLRALAGQFSTLNPETIYSAAGGH